jgi:hypothetical protein
VFLASRPNPELTLGELTVRATVSESSLDSVHLIIVWRLILPPGRRPEDVRLDYLDLLWPGEVRGGRPGPGARSLSRSLEADGFTTIEEGELPLFSLETRTREALGSASFVTIVREGGGLGLTPPASLIRIPWSPKLTALTMLRMETSLVRPKTRTLIEGVYSGWQYSVSLGFHDVSHATLHTLYFDRRTHVVPLAGDMTQLSIVFTGRERLRIGTMTPASATRAPSETLDDAEVVSSLVETSDRRVPQRLTVDFAYFDVWRGIATTVAFFLFAQLIAPWAVGLLKAIPSAAGTYVRVGRRLTADRAIGAILSREALDRIRPAQTTYAELLEICGRPTGEHERLGIPGERRVVYEGRRVVPRIVVQLGWLALVRRWEIEHHRVEIEVREGRVTQVDLDARWD